MALQVLSFELTYGKIHGTRGEGHVSKGWIHARAGGHACAIGYKHIQRIPNLVVTIEYRRLGIASHTRRSHLMDALAEAVGIVEGTHIFHARGLEHLRAIVHHVLAHLQLVFLDFHVHRQHRQPPFIFHRFIQRNMVIMVRQYFTQRTETYRPGPGLTHRVLPFAADAHLGNFAAPPAAARRPLVSEAADVVSLISAHIAASRDIQSVRPPAIVVAVFIPFHTATRAATEMMVHGVMAKLTTATAQSTFPHIGCGIHQYPGGVERRSANKYDLGEVFIRLVGFRIDNLHALGLFGVFVIQYPRDDGKWPQRQVAGGHRSGQGRRLRAEVATEVAPEPALALVLAIEAALLGG